MVDLIKKYLRVNNFSHLQLEFEEAFLSHPNYPSLYAITDSLSLLSIENIAVKIPREQFIELPKYFLAIYNNKIVLVTKLNTSVTVLMDGGKQVNLSFNEFIDSWNQISIIIEPNNISKSKSQKTFYKWSLYILPCIALISLSLYFNFYSIEVIVVLLTSIIGLIFGIFVLQEKLGVQNNVVSKLCSLNVKTSCDSVIKSNKSFINKWIDFSDLPLLFFSGSIMSILIHPNDSAVLISSLSLISIPIIIYSIWLQKVELKKWCVLCLLIATIIFLQSLIFVAKISFDKIEYINPFVFLFSIIISTSLWFFVRPILNRKIQLENENSELKRFKRDYNIFKSLIKDIPNIDGLDRLNGIVIGKNNLDIELVVIVSPSCGHCHKAFEDAYTLVKKYPDRVSLKVLFNVNPENKENPYRVVVDSLLGINNVNADSAEEAIIDWHVNKMDFEKWKQKWVVANVDMVVNHQIYKQYEWCLQNEFNYTPVKIINRKMFPKEYELSELKYFIGDFSKENETNYVLTNI